MPPIKGKSIVLLVDVDGGPTYEQMGSQRGMTIEQSATFIDTSSKDSDDQTGLQGRRSSSVSLDAVYVPDETRYAALLTAFRAASTILVQVHEGDPLALRLSANAVITGMTEEFPDDDAATISVELQITAGWTEV